MEYVAVQEPTASSSRSLRSPVIWSKKKASVSSGPMSPKQFEVVSPVNGPRKSYVDDPCFDAALNREASGSRRRKRFDRLVPPNFALAKRKCN